MKQRAICCVLALWGIVLVTALSVSLQAQAQLDVANVCDVPTMAHQTIQAWVGRSDSLSAQLLNESPRRGPPEGKSEESQEPNCHNPWQRNID